MRALQFVTGLSNGTRGPIHYQVERFDLVIGGITLVHKAHINTGTFIPLAGHRSYRDAPFSQAQINSLFGQISTGQLEAHMLYGRPGGRMTRRYKVILELTLDLASGVQIADVVKSESDELIY